MASGSRVGAYELLERLGAGGMAETFVALRRGPAGFEQRVCLKRILPGHAGDDEFVRLFLDEAQLAARLRHANVVSVLDFGEADGAYFLALELVDGVDLRRLLRHLRREGRDLTSGLVVFVALELAAALDHAHRPDPGTGRGAIVHRDLSPSNVLLSTAGEVKLADFGIAKAVERTRVTRTGVSRGKVPYMAPEYALDGHSGPGTDLFALGVTLYECLAGRRPYDGASDVDTLRRAAAGEHGPLGTLRPGLPAAIADAVERLIAPDPADRFPTAAAFQDALVGDQPPPTARRILGELVAEARATAGSRRPGGASPARGGIGAAPEAVALADAPTRTATPPPPVEDTTRPERPANRGAAGPDRSPGAPVAAEADTQGDADLGSDATTRPRPVPPVDDDAPATAGARAPRGVGGLPWWWLVPAGAAVFLTVVVLSAVAVRSLAGAPRPGGQDGPGGTAAARTAPEHDPDSPPASAAAVGGGDPDTRAPRVPGPAEEPTATAGSTETGPAVPGGQPARGDDGAAPTAAAGLPDSPDPAAGPAAGEDEEHRPSERARRAARATGDERDGDLDPSGRAVLEIRVLPHGEVRVDGRYVGKSPVQVRGLRPGVHRIEVLQDGAPVRRSRVRLEAGEVKRITL